MKLFDHRLKEGADDDVLLDVVHRHAPIDRDKTAIRAGSSDDTDQVRLGVGDLQMRDKRRNRQMIEASALNPTTRLAKR